jgi:hypothetical protein
MGVLDSDGDGRATLIVPPGLGMSAIGLVGHFAWVSYELGPFSIDDVSNAAFITLTMGQRRVVRRFVGGRLAGAKAIARARAGRRRGTDRRGGGCEFR